MTDLELLPITEFTPATDGRFLSQEQHPKWLGLKSPEMVGKKYGLQEVISEEIIRKGTVIQIPHHRCRCTQCGYETWVNRHTLLKIVSGGCKKCARRYAKHCETLGRRYNHIMARCYDPQNCSYSRYGARGITCAFQSRKEFVQWVEQNLPHPTYKDVQIDRIDNNGNYEPGNLRLATHREQSLNRHNNVWMSYQGERILMANFPSPYPKGHTHTLVVKQGLTGEEIIQRALKAVQQKALGWKDRLDGLQKLGYMISPMQDQEEDSQLATS